MYIFLCYPLFYCSYILYPLFCPVHFSRHHLTSCAQHLHTFYCACSHLSRYNVKPFLQVVLNFPLIYKNRIQSQQLWWALEKQLCHSSSTVLIYSATLVYPWYQVYVLSLSKDYHPKSGKNILYMFNYSILICIKILSFHILPLKYFLLQYCQYPP